MKKLLKVVMSLLLIIMVMTSCTSNTATKVTGTGKNASGSSQAKVTTTAPTTMSTIAPTTLPSVISKLKIGDYVKMGRYYKQPILWRCVDIDENGPLMLSDKILTLKSFDAQGTHKYLDGTTQKEYGNYRTSMGSNLWQTSNLRSWLNSTATAGNVTWLDGCPPTQNKVYNGYNDYATEKGFLADGNFSAKNRNAIQSVNQKSLLDGYDVSKLSVGGTASHSYDQNISTFQDISKLVSNYDTAYYDNVTDKMFLLDVKQVNRVYQNRKILGKNYYIGKPTQKAFDNSESKFNGLHTASNWHYWLRTPCKIPSLDGIYVRGVFPSGYVNHYYAAANLGGVRPAFYIDIQSAIFKSGNGTENDPYVVQS